MTAGIVGAVTGFASSFVIVLTGFAAVGASPREAASGLLVLCTFQGLLAIVLSVRHRMPISFAWSTPGAAVLVAAEATTDDYSAAVGAFLLCGVLIALTGLWPWLARVMTSIPAAVGSALLAGILLPICLAPVAAVVATPWAAVPPILVWLVLSRLAPRWAVPGAVVATVVAVLVTAGTGWLADASIVPQVAWVVPSFDPAVLVGLGIPLYIVTMAGQNVPGFAALRTFGYTPTPAREILVSTGVATAAAAPFGGFAMNLSAITAALMAGPDAHPDPSRRWVAAVSGGVTYLVLAVGAGLAGALVAASPPTLITSVAGLALLGALGAAVATALERPDHRIVAVGTFVVVVSGVTVSGVGSAVWGLLVGLVLLAVQTIGRRAESPEGPAR